MVMSDARWLPNAACKEYPLPEFEYLWFPKKPSEMPVEARNICADCPVKADCRTYSSAIEGGKAAKDRHGNWNGRTPLERARRYRADVQAARMERNRRQKDSPSAK